VGPGVEAAEVVPAAPSDALVVNVETWSAHAAGAELVLCPCGGPALLCGGAEVCAGPPASDVDFRWLTAIRAVFAGLLLGDTEAALWGGALLRFARRIGSGRPPAEIAEAARSLADPRCAVSGSEAVRMALAFLVDHDLDAAFDLQCALGRANARWLGMVWRVADRSVRAIPRASASFPLLAVPCNDCAATAGASTLGLMVPVGTYDAAIRCPTCGAVPRHPLPWVKVGEPHPVGRCVRGFGPTNLCMLHKHELDADGLCVEGREILQQAVVEERSPGPKDPVFLDAMARARRLWMDGGGLVRAVVTSETFGPAFAALAAANPETAKVLERMAGAPIDVTIADPAILAEVSPHASLESVVAAGVDALKSVMPSLGGLLGQKAPRAKRLPAPRKPRRSDETR